jgi:hypothetical protein
MATSEENRKLGRRINKDIWNEKRSELIPQGPIPASDRPVKYAEIVIMEVRDGKVCRQIASQLRALRFSSLQSVSLGSAGSSAL